MRKVSSVPSCCTEMSTTAAVEHLISRNCSTVCPKAMVNLISQQIHSRDIQASHPVCTSIPEQRTLAQTPRPSKQNGVQDIRTVRQLRSDYLGICDSRHQSSNLCESPWYLERWRAKPHSCHRSLRSNTTSPLYSFFFFEPPRGLSTDGAAMLAPSFFFFWGEKQYRW